MRVICQSGVEAEFKCFGVGGKFKNHVIGTQENGNQYDIGEYKDAFTALTILSKIIQHEGEELYRMPQM